MAEDLRRFLGGLPIKARPIGRVERSWKWVKRYPAITALIAALLIASPLLVLEWRQAALATTRAERPKPKHLPNATPVAGEKPN